MINDAKVENIANLKELFNKLHKKKKNQIRLEIIANQKNEKMKMKIKVMQIKAFTYYIFKLKKMKPKNDLEKIKSLLEAEKRLFCSFSHELKTPINGALPTLEIVKLNVENEEILSLLDISVCSLKILNNSIDNILDHYLLESKQLFLNENKFYLQDLISEIDQIISPMTIVKKIDFMINYSENFKKLKIRADYQKLKQILINLLTNSVQFTNIGNITLSFEKINFSRLKFIIKDTGIGISRENLEKLLGKIKFVSDDQINKTGSCLGLSISEKLITYIGDSEGLIIQSEENKGTEVSFIIENNLSQDQSNFEMKPEKYKPQTYTSIRNSVESYFKRSKSKKSKRNFTMSSHVKTYTLNTKKDTHKTVLSSIETVEKVINSYDFDFLIKNAKKRASCRNIALDFTDDEKDIEMNFESRDVSKKKYLDNYPFERGNQPDCNESLCDCEEILYVDDDAFNLLSLEMMLRTFNLKCCKLMSGRKAIETLLENSSCGRNNCKKFKLIFLDYQMPLMDGIETAIKIRELMEKNIIKKRNIIGCTAFVSKSEVLKCLEAGMREVIFKPINCNIIKSLLEEYF